MYPAFDATNPPPEQPAHHQKITGKLTFNAVTSCSKDSSVCRIWSCLTVLILDPQTRLVRASRSSQGLTVVPVSDPPGAAYPITATLPSLLALGRESSTHNWCVFLPATTPCHACVVSKPLQATSVAGSGSLGDPVS